MVISLVKNQNIYTVIKILLGAGKGSVMELCDIAGISRSSYYKWVNRIQSTSELENEKLIPLIKNAYEEKDGVLGYRQMTIKLSREQQPKC